jgi:hypothetical protein
MEPLAEICQDLFETLNAHVEGIDATSDLIDQLSEADAVCTYYQGVAICELLLDAEVDAFFHHLIRSAQTRRWMLQRRAPSNEEGALEVLKASNTRGLFAALVARQWSLASDIARLSLTTWAQDVEYEDDFCYAQFLHRYLLRAPDPEQSKVLQQFEAALEGNESPRHNLCRHLLARNSDGCAEAFATLLEERREQLLKMKRESALSRDSLFQPFSAVFVEGLAWLALMERAGFPTDRDYMYCPSLARKTVYAPFEVTTFPSVPL